MTLCRDWSALKHLAAALGDYNPISSCASKNGFCLEVSICDANENTSKNCVSVCFSNYAGFGFKIQWKIDVTNGEGAVIMEFVFSSTH